MATSIVNGAKITSSGTGEVEIEFNSAADYFSSAPQTAYIELDANNSGTIQFSVNETITSEHNTWGAGDKLILSFKNGYRNIRYKASAASQIFTITV